jgi:hypothetical protein
MLKARGRWPEAEFWERGAGQEWLRLLVFAVVFVFGIKGGVGVERISEFFHRVRLDRHVGSSPTALRSLRRQLEEVILAYQATQQRERRPSEHRIGICAGADKTFFDQVILVLMDLTSGYIVLEEPAADRRYDTWQARVHEALEPLGIRLRYLVSDRAKALVKLALDGFHCLSMPDVFHALRDLAKVVGVSFHLKLARLEDKRAQAQRTLSGLQTKGKNTYVQERLIGHLDEQIATLRADQAGVQQRLREASSAVHPFALSDSSRQQAVHNQCACGTPTQRLKVLTVIHNFDLQRTNGTTAAERLFGTAFPDLFDRVVEHMGALPMPRKARTPKAPKLLNLPTVPARVDTRPTPSACRKASPKQKHDPQRPPVSVARILDERKVRREVKSP